MNYNLNFAKERSQKRSDVTIFDFPSGAAKNVYEAI